MTEGIKYDTEKDRWDLLPFQVIKDVVKVLTLGAKKYADDNWKNVEPYRKRYLSACMRHIVAWEGSEINDPETKIHHLAHAICCLIFIIWKDKYAIKC